MKRWTIEGHTSGWTPEEDEHGPWVLFEEAEDEIRRLRVLIAQAEWGSYDRVAGMSCPWCQASQEEDGGHAKGCPAFPDGEAIP